MKRFLIWLVVVAVLVGGAARVAIEFPLVQNRALDVATRAAVSQLAQGFPQPDSLQAYVCGSASPLPAPGRAQACIAIVTPQHFFIVDSGASSSAKVSAGRLPMNRLQGVFVTHLHSDHIADIPELNLTSWVAGRPTPLIIYGPAGVRALVSGLNTAYELDRGYRIAHHGEAMLPPALGVLDHHTVRPGFTMEDGDLTITAYLADHAPISPAFGYRFDYRGRSIVVSGDSNVTAETIAISNGADLLLHDALSEPIVSAMSRAAYGVGMDRNGKLLADVLDYHAWTSALVELNGKAKIGMVAYYHMVPAPANFLMERVMLRDAPDNFVLTNDGDRFELPVGSKEIIVH